MVPEEQVDRQVEERVHSTYRYLRVIAVVPAAWLILSIVVVALLRREILDSISDYYGGPLRDVFVGALMASGICLIAYKGESRLEDYVLNFAGFNTFLVALVPNSFPDLLAAAKAAEGTSTPPAVSSADLLQNLGIAVGTLVVVAVVFVVLDHRFFKWTRFSWAEQGRFANALICISWVLEVALLVIVVVVLVMAFSRSEKTWAFTVVHFAAASFMILNFAFAASSHAFPGRLRTDADAPGDTKKVQTIFRVIASGMAIGLLFALVAIPTHFPYAVILVEIYEILLFIAFWVVATREEWLRDAVRT